MEVSRCLTVSDIELLNLAMQRKRKALPTDELLFTEGFHTDCFVSQSLHHPLENVNGSEIERHHHIDYYILKDDMYSYLRFVFQQAEFIPWKTNKLSSKISPLTRFNRMLSLDDYRYDMSSLLWKMVKKVVPRQRVTWIIHLLLTFHYGHECSLYVTTAMKIFFGVFRFFPFSFYVEFIYLKYNMKEEDACGRAADTLQRYLKIILRNNCSEDVLATAMGLFYFHTNMNKFIFRDVPDIKYILETTQNANMEPPRFLSSHEPGRLKSFDLCVIVDWQNFVSLVQFGCSSVFSRDDKNILKERGMEEIDFDTINFPNHGECNPVFAFDHFSLRLNQVVHLFLKSEVLCNEAEFVLKLLWASIPDPYLTLEEVEDFMNEPINIMKSVAQQGTFRARGFFLNLSPKDHPSPESLERATMEMTSRGYRSVIRRFCLAGTPSRFVISQAMNWYRKNMEDTLVKSPRSLLHLSRCVVRQSLASNFQLPKGVSLLNLPKCVQNYLLLEDCGSNPFNEKHHLRNTLERLYHDIFH